MLVHIDRTQFRHKPSGTEIGGIKYRFIKPESIQDLTIEQIVECLRAGRTVQPGVTPFSERSRAKGRNGTCEDDFARQRLFMNDHDNKKTDVPIETPAYVAEVLAGYNVQIAFAYPTFNSTPERERFRIGFVCDEEITDKAERDGIQKALIRLFPQSDPECANADRMFFGTDKDFYEGIGNMNAVCRKADLLALAAIVNAAEESEPESNTEGDGGIIPVGQREKRMFEECTRIIHRYGDTDEARERYNAVVRRLEVVPGEADPPQKKAGYIWKRCVKYFHEVSEKRPGYVSPQEYNATAQEDFAPRKRGKSRKPPISYYTGLSAAYIREHRYIVGVQKLCKGGYGNDTIYEYNRGVWNARSESDVKSDLAKRVLSEGVTPDPDQIAKAYRVIVMSGSRKDVEDFNADENLVCFQNGVYRLSDGATLPHSPDHYFTIQLNASIPTALAPTPYCDMCLSNFGGADVQNLLLEVCGAAISNVFIPRFKKAVLQYGVGDSGKTQLKRLMERIIGGGNYNNVDLSDLENNRFLPAAFQGVRIGGSNDMSNVRIKEQKIFKQLTGGDSIQAENKGEKTFTFRYKGLLWFLANQLPLFGGDKGKHVYDRWIVIPCKNAIPEEQQIKDLEERMFQERDSFCLKALRAFQTAVADNYTFHIPESCRLANEEYRRKNSTVRTFIEECCEPLNRDECPKESTTGKFWKWFKRWCADGNSYLPGKAEFKRELAAIAGIDEAELVFHNKDGNFYPFAVTEQAMKEISEYPEIPFL